MSCRESFFSRPYSSKTKIFIKLFEKKYILDLIVFKPKVKELFSSIVPVCAVTGTDNRCVLCGADMMVCSVQVCDLKVLCSVW